jgi:hypothetical protein
MIGGMIGPSDISTVVMLGATRLSWLSIVVLRWADGQQSRAQLLLAGFLGNWENHEPKVTQDMTMCAPVSGKQRSLW